MLCKHKPQRHSSVLFATSPRFVLFQCNIPPPGTTDVLASHRLESTTWETILIIDCDHVVWLTVIQGLWHQLWRHWHAKFSVFYISNGRIFIPNKTRIRNRHQLAVPIKETAPNHQLNNDELSSIRFSGIHSAVNFTWLSKISIHRLYLKFIHLKWQPHTPWDNELISIALGYSPLCANIHVLCDITIQIEVE